MRFIIYLFFCTALLLGCNSRNPTPELQDPIYSIYVSEYQSALREVADVEKELDMARNEAKRKDVLGGTPRIVRERNLTVLLAKLNRVQQEAEYKRVRVDARQREARLSYNRAVNKGAVWPDPSEVAVYKKNLELRLRPRAWDQNLDNRIQASRMPANAAAHTSEGHH